jgi:hypothetical protein
MVPLDHASSQGRLNRCCPLEMAMNEIPYSDHRPNGAVATTRLPATSCAYHASVHLLAEFLR